MHRSIQVFFVAALIAFPCMARAAEGDDAGADEIKKFEQQWLDSAAKGDVTLLEQMLSDDYTLTNPVGQIVSKSDLIGKIKDGTFKIESVEHGDLKARVYGDAAVLTGRVDIKATWEGNDVSGSYAFTNTYIKKDGKWQEVAGQVTRVGE